jgi:hypothetical protein
LHTKVAAITTCSSAEDPNCSTGSNVGSGIYSAIQQFSNSTYTGTSKNIVIITDGVPNASSGVTYTTADGVSCGKNCQDSDLQTGTQAQALAAKNAGINISAIYYSGDTDVQDQSTYQTFLAGLISGTGTALLAPTAAKLAASYSALCASIPFRPEADKLISLTRSNLMKYNRVVANSGRCLRKPIAGLGRVDG